MRNLKKFIILFALVFSISLTGCNSEQSLNGKNETASAENNTTTEPSKEETKPEEKKPEKEEKKPEEKKPEKEDSKSENALTDDEKATIEEFVERLEKYENGTAGASLKMDRLFTEIVNRSGFFEDKKEESKEYLLKQVAKVKDSENFLLSLRTLKYTVEEYKEDKQAYIERLQDSGAEWNPQIKIETLEEMLNAIPTK